VRTDSARVSRRSFVMAGSGLLAAAASSAAQQPAFAQPTVDRLLRAQSVSGGRILLRGGIVLSLDPKVGDFEKADVLIEGKRIAAVGPNLTAAATSAVVVDGGDRGRRRSRYRRRGGRWGALGLLTCLRCGGRRSGGARGQLLTRAQRLGRQPDRLRGQ